MEDMPEIFSFPRTFPELSQATGQDVSISLHFVRHGEKRKDGKLARRAVGEAERLGEQIVAAHPGKLVLSEVYSGTKERVQETAQAISRGMQRRARGEIYGPTVYPLLSHQTFLFSEQNSTYFQRVNKRLERAFDSGPLGKRGRVRQAEKANMRDWLSSNKGRPDQGTASPWEIMQNVTAMIGACIDEMEHRPSNSHTDYILVTHEYILAPIVQYLLMQGRAGKLRVGQDIFDDIERIDYLEDVTIIVKRDTDGESYMYATIRGNDYIIASQEKGYCQNTTKAAA